MLKARFNRRPLLKWIAAFIGISPSFGPGMCGSEGRSCITTVVLSALEIGRIDGPHLPFLSFRVCERRVTHW